MWLPTPVYERIPQFWFLLGLLFIAGGLYIGLHYPVSIAYVVIGFGCMVFSICVAMMRSKNRNPEQRHVDESEPTTK